MSARRFAPSQHASGLTKALASQHFSFSFCGLAQQRMRNRWLRRSGSTLVGWLPDDLAEVLRSRRRRRADKRRRKPERADGLYWQIPGIVGKVGSGEGVAPGEEPSALFGERACLCCGLFESGPQLMQERRSLPV